MTPRYAVLRPWDTDPRDAFADLTAEEAAMELIYRYTDDAVPDIRMDSPGYRLWLRGVRSVFYSPEYSEDAARADLIQKILDHDGDDWGGYVVVSTEELAEIKAADIQIDLV